jgi:hypothetical protein
MFGGLLRVSWLVVAGLRRFPGADTEMGLERVKRIRSGYRKRRI